MYVRIGDALRILASYMNDPGARRQGVWTALHCGRQYRRLLGSDGREFAGRAVGDLTRYVLSGIRPVCGRTEECSRAAASWLLQAMERTDDDGVSLGFFPLDDDGGWKPSYPETTGYVITSLLNYSRTFEDRTAADKALAMAHWEAEIQMPSGAVQGGPVTTPENQTAAAFNTGMVLDGWVTALDHRPEERLLQAARRAADFLVQDLGDDGLFRTNGAFVSPDAVKLYNCLCGWALQRFAQLTGESPYEDAAVRAAEAAMERQDPGGYYPDNCLGWPEAPLTHTIGYTLQGILEVGVAAGRDDLIDSARRGLEPILPLIRRNGFLAGRVTRDWKVASFSSCLTGSAQLAVICFRFYELEGGEHWKQAAERLLGFLKAIQLRGAGDPRSNGALPGSFPFIAHYMSGGFPNWATKYLLDALLAETRVSELASAPPEDNRSIVASGSGAARTD